MKMKAESRRISSAWTLYAKFVHPFIVDGLLLWSLFELWKMNPALGYIAMLPAFLMMGYVTYSCVRLKEVELSGNRLVVSNFFRSAEVSLVNVKKIRKRKWPRKSPVQLLLDQNYGFGMAIVFVPRSEYHLECLYRAVRLMGQAGKGKATDFL